MKGKDLTGSRLHPEASVTSGVYAKLPLAPPSWQHQEGTECSSPACPPLGMPVLSPLPECHPGSGKGWDRSGLHSIPLGKSEEEGDFLQALLMLGQACSCTISPGAWLDSRNMI